ncbi:MAG: hypothetical protein EPN57_21705 [Paraburkholderia sp.]|nr:MAG: hypothetical protein EPN57_21705 [Paraburkholderia sp.]
MRRDCSCRARDTLRARIPPPAFSRSVPRSCCIYPCYLLAQVCGRSRLLGGNTETTSLEFILNPFKLFFTASVALGHPRVP